MKDSDVVDAFVAHLAKDGYPCLKVDRRPEEENRGSPDIDAIAGPFAIEHTSIDTLQNQRRDADWFMNVAGGLEDEIERKLPFRLNIILKYDSVGKGQDWPSIRQALRNWVEHESPSLPEGRSIIEKPSGIPFPLDVTKSSKRRRGVFIGRFRPDDDTLPTRVKAAFNRKAMKLAKYHRPEFTTILLVENDDIALMNEGKLIEAIKEAFPDGPPAGVDLVWYADTSIPGALEFRDFTQEISKSNT